MCVEMTQFYMTCYGIYDFITSVYRLGSLTFTVESYYSTEVRVVKVTINIPKVGALKRATHLSASLIESVL